MANVFISHRKADVVEAERLAVEIRNDSHQVWFDEWDISTGDSIVQKINEGLASANYLVLCYSASDVMSPWTSREWMSALSRQLEKGTIKVLPVRLTGDKAPAIINDLKPADLMQDWAKGVAELLRAIR